MALTESTMMPIGTQAPAFNILDTVTGDTFSLVKTKGEKATVVMFICNHCPYVIHLNDEMVKIANEFSTKGIQFIAISSNDVEKYPMDGPKYMKAHAKEVGYPFPYLYDESQEVAKAYDAACTPDFYVFDKSLKLAYRGRLDPSSPGNGKPITGADLRGALNALVADQFVSEIQYPSMGCNIKWKA